MRLGPLAYRKGATEWKDIALIYPDRVPRPVV